MHSGSWRAAVIATSTSALLAIGCAAQKPIQPPAAAEETGSLPLSAELRRHRSDEGHRIIQVTMTNAGTTPVIVHELALDAPGFTTLPPTPKGSTVRPGIPVDLPIPYGTTDCTDPASAAAEAGRDERIPVVRLRVSPVPGPEQDIRLEVDPAPLERVLAAECRQAALARAVTVAFAGHWAIGTRAGLPALNGTLVLTRGDAIGPVTVTALDGSTLLALNTGSVPPQLPFVLPADADHAELAIQVTAQSCDPHVRSQSQRPYELSVYVSVNGAEPLFVAPSVDQAAQAGMQEVIAATCAG